MPDVTTVACPVCGTANAASASHCTSCGVALTRPRTISHVDDLLKDLLEPTAETPVPAGDILDLDAEIVDELLDSIIVEEKPGPAPAPRVEEAVEEAVEDAVEVRVECPLCGHEVAEDARRCDNCGTEFEEVVLEAPPSPAAPTRALAREPPAVEIPVAAATTESQEKQLHAFLAGRSIDLVVIGTVAGLAAVFLGFRMYSWSSFASDLTPVYAFLGVGAAGMAAGLLLFRISTSALAQGDRLVKSGRHQEALAYYDRAIRMGHRPSNAWTSRGVALKRLGRLEEALRCQQMAVRLDPDNEIAWCNQGDLHFRLGDFAKAMESYEKAIKIRPKYAIAWNNKGAALARMNRFEEAKECHDQAVRLQPKYVAAWLNRGEVLARLGYRAEAQKCLERARALGA